jgi:cytochrome bd-type quinol oxidase subunit 2
MVNNDRVALMTRLAIYEANHGHEDDMLQQYHKKDYIRIQSLKTIFFSSIAFVLIIALWLCVAESDVLLQLRDGSVKKISFIIGVIYIIFLWINLRINRLIQGRRYENAKGRNYRYMRQLMELGQMYEEEQLANYVANKEKEMELNEPVISD